MEGSQSGNRARYQKGKVYIETIEKLKDFTMKDDLSEKDIDKLDADLKEQLKQITIARIRTVSSDTKISLGSEDYSVEELVNHVEEGDQIGKDMVQMNWQYLKDLAAGALYDNE